jgi:integrase
MSDADRARIITLLSNGEVQQARSATSDLRRSDGELFAANTLQSIWSSVARDYVLQADEEHKVYERKLHRLLDRFTGDDMERFMHDVAHDRWRLHCFWKQIQPTRVSKKTLAWMRPELIARLQRLGAPFPRACAFSKLPQSVLEAAYAARAKANRNAVAFELPEDPTALKRILEVFHGLLQSHELVDLYIGLLLCTGRREQELIQATWSPQDQEGAWVKWSNTQKIVAAPVLCRMSLFVEAHRTFRLLLAARQITSAQQLRAELNKRVAHLCVHNESLLHAMADGQRRAPVATRLRELYVSIAIRAIPHSTSDGQFAADVLGDGLKASMNFAPRTRTCIEIQ